LYPKYKGGPRRKFTLGQRREIKKIARSKPAEHGPGCVCGTGSTNPSS
jgi:hypothetical protein